MCEMGPVIKERLWMVKGVELAIWQAVEGAMTTLDGESRKRRSVCEMGPVIKERHGR